MFFFKVPSVEVVISVGKCFDFHNRLAFIDSFVIQILYFWKLFQSGKNYPINKAVYVF